MVPFCIYILVLLSYFSLLGMPVSFLLALRCSDSKRAGVYAMAPILGVVIQIYFGIGFHVLFSFRPRIVVGSVFLLMVIFSFLIIRQSSVWRQEIKGVLYGLICIFVCGAIAILLNSADLHRIALDNYFPITNGDTFAYLGHIDQFRLTGQNTPVIEYPAGYKPAIEHAFGGRDTVVAFTAGLAEFLNLETHTAFFISQRLSFILLVTGVFGILFFITSSILVAIVGSLMAMAGNFFLHQLLQQFSSSSWGAVLALLLVFTFCWEIQRKRAEAESSWSLLCGFIAGVLFMVSPETGVVTLFIVGFWFIVAHFNLYFRLILKSVGSFVFGFILGVLPMLSRSVLFAYNQANSVLRGHPGDWIANSAILFQASGIGFTTSVGLSSLSTIQVIGSVLTSLFYLFALLLIVVKIKKPGNLDFVEDSKPVALFAIASLLITIVLFYLGKGYSMLKTLDYFSFLHPLVFGLAFGIVLKEHNLRFRGLVLFIGTAFIMFFVVLAIPEKYSILKSYARTVRGIPRISDLKLSNPSLNVAEVVPDLIGDSLDLFLYVNRFNNIKFAYYAEESNRYRPMTNPSFGMPFVRVSVPGYRDKIFADITHTVPWQVDPYLVSYDGTMRIIGPNWLSPEGSSGENLYRWLSLKGAFTLYLESSSLNRHIKMNIYPGPDLLPANTIEIQVNDLVLRIVRFKDLPLQLDFLVSNLKPGLNTGAVVVRGPFGGIRQVSVAQMSNISF